MRGYANDMGHTELHFHLLPGVDDGPVDMAETVELARAASRDGTTDIVATPHVRLAEPAEVAGRVAEVQERLDGDDVEVAVHSGGELHPDDVPALSDHELELLAIGPPGCRWLLLEAPLFGSAEALPLAAREVQERGYAVVVAHPERSQGLSDIGAEETLREIAGRGGAVQVNAGSLTGYHGPDARESALGLIRAGLVYALASDAHRKTRGPLLTSARAEVASEFGEDAARSMVDVMPRALLFTGIRVPAYA